MHLKRGVHLNFKCYVTKIFLQPSTHCLIEVHSSTANKIDRLARNTKDLLTIVDQIAAAGASLKILDLGIKTDTPIGKMILTVLGAVSELERSYINERTRKGSSSLNS